MKKTGAGKKRMNEFPKFVYILLLLSVAVVWGYGFVAVDNSLESGIGSFGLLAFRFWTAAGVIFLFRAFLPKGEIKSKITKKEIWLGAVCGVVNFLGFFFQTVGLRYTDPARSGMLTATYVIVVPLVCSVIYKKFSWISLLNAVVFFVGMVFLVDLKRVGGFGLGDSLTVLSSMFFAAQIIMVEFFCLRLNPVNFNGVQMLFMGIFGTIGALVFEWNTFINIRWEKLIFPVLFLSVFNSAYAYIVQTVAQRKVSSALTAILLSLESITSVLFSLALGKTQWSLPLAIGCVIMAAASASASLTDVKPQLPTLKTTEKEEEK